MKAEAHAIYRTCLKKYRIQLRKATHAAQFHAAGTGYASIMDFTMRLLTMRKRFL